MKCLLVEDNEALAKNIIEFLIHENNICEVAYSYQEAREKCLLHQYDAVILDLMLPDGDGMQLLQLIKEHSSETSVIITSAKNSLDIKLIGLDGGADDYLTKPFPLPELNSRLKAIFRRKLKQSSNKIVFNELQIDTAALEVFVNGTPLSLTKKEVNLLLYFYNNKNRVLSRHNIALHLWGDYVDNLDNYDFVYQHVKNLRKKITDAGGDDYISTVYGLGYKFNA